MFNYFIVLRLFSKLRNSPSFLFFVIENYVTEAIAGFGVSKSFLNVLSTQTRFSTNFSNWKLEANFEPQKRSSDFEERFVNDAVSFGTSGFSGINFSSKIWDLIWFSHLKNLLGKKSPLVNLIRKLLSEYYFKYFKPYLALNYHIVSFDEEKMGCEHCYSEFCLKKWRIDHFFKINRND